MGYIAEVYAVSHSDFFAALVYAAPVAPQGEISKRQSCSMAGCKDAVPVSGVSADMRLPDTNHEFCRRPITHRVQIRPVVLPI